MAETQRYTLTLPTEIYEELRSQAEKHSVSITEAVRTCIKLGLLAMKIDERVGGELVIREKNTDAKGEEVFKETQLKIVW